MGDNSRVQVPSMPLQQEMLGEGKGVVHREVESEGSRIQTSGPTDRNHIRGYYCWVRLQNFGYGFRPGRKAHDAVHQAQSYLNDGYIWIVDIGMDKFFDRVNHDRLIYIQFLLIIIRKRFTVDPVPLILFRIIIPPEALHFFVFFHFTIGFCEF